MPSVQSAFLILFIHGLALPLGMTKDPASGVIKQSMSAERRTLLRTLGADRSKMTRCLRVKSSVPHSRESARAFR